MVTKSFVALLLVIGILSQAAPPPRQSAIVMNVTLSAMESSARGCKGKTHFVHLASAMARTDWNGVKEAGLCLLKFIGPVPLRFWPIG